MQFDYELLYPDENAAVEMAYPVPAAGAGFGGGGAGGHGSQWPNVAVLSAVLLVALAANFLALPVILFRYEKKIIKREQAEGGENMSLVLMASMSHSNRTSLTNLPQEDKVRERSVRLPDPLPDRRRPGGHALQRPRIPRRRVEQLSVGRRAGVVQGK